MTLNFQIFKRRMSIMNLEIVKVDLEEEMNNLDIDLSKSHGH